MKTHLTFAFVLAALTAAPAFAATAIWTGQMEFVTTVTYQSGVRCQYQYAGNYFWKTFAGASCPGMIQVQ